MTTFENAPPPADWVQPAGFICGGCQRDGNLCASLVLVDEQPCCSACSHGATAGSKANDIPYYGD